MELIPFLEQNRGERAHYESLVTGVGPLETAVTLGRYLAEHHKRISGVVQFGVGGAYIAAEPGNRVPLLAICLAEAEIMGDLGICYPDRMKYFPEDLSGQMRFSLRSTLLSRAAEVLGANGIGYHYGTFVTVNSVSGTARRGEMLSRHWQALCENMEGAAAARLCKEYTLPLLEIRVISNLVEDRNRQNWRLREACLRAGEIAALLVKEL
jgi:futalosine hydrolase